MLFLCSCSEEPQGNQYFPLQKGLELTYKVTTEYPKDKQQSELTISNIGKINFDEKSYFVRRTSSGIDYYHNHDETGTFREGLRTLVELKPRLDLERRYVLKLPLEVGSSWSEITRPLLLMRVHPYKELAAPDSQIPMAYEIESISETITVAAGTFDNCIKVVAEGKTEVYTDPVNGYTDIPFFVEEWYAPNVGLVKLVRSELYDKAVDVLDTPIYIGGKKTLELTSFKN